MRIRLLALLVFVLAAPAIASAQPSGCSSIAVSATGATQPRGAKVPSFSISRVVNLDLAVLFKPGNLNRFTSGAHTAEFRVYSPTGALYQNISVAFTSDTKKKGQPQRIDGYPRPVPIQLIGDIVTATGKHGAVSTPLAVAGSPIVLNSMFGEWRLEAVIDEETASCATPAVFRIEP